MAGIIARPKREALIQCLDGHVPVPYQWINWWLYQRGIDDLLKSATDFGNPWYSMCSRNQEKIVCDLARWQGISHRRIDLVEEERKFFCHRLMEGAYGRC